MLMLSDARIEQGRLPRHRRAELYQPGELYSVLYMTKPVVITVLAREPGTVKVWFGTLSVEEFEERVVCKLGRRVRLFGVWMPWAICDQVNG